MQYRLPQPYYYDSGPVGVVLLHAYTGSANDVHMMGRFLEKQQISVLAPHFTGHATFEPLDILEKGNVQAWWADTTAAIQKLQVAAKKPLFVFGLSLGGLFAMRAIETMPAVIGGGIFSAPVLEGPTDKLAPLFMGYAQRLYQMTEKTAADQAVQLAKIKQQLPQQLQAIADFSALVTADLDQIGDKPVFIGQGGQDQVIDPNGASALKQRLEAQQTPVDYHWYDNAGHVITVDRAHHQLEADVEVFIKRYKK
ncbi:lipase [Latilactobacillus sakei]|nr:alpha/beta fold hydrolase [Latilactobacillus sakei]AUX12317.1 lipase [Latilactobacillus sakei]